MDWFPISPGCQLVPCWVFCWEIQTNSPIWWLQNGEVVRRIYLFQIVKWLWTNICCLGKCHHKRRYFVVHIQQLRSSVGNNQRFELLFKLMWLMRVLKGYSVLLIRTSLQVAIGINCTSKGCYPPFSLLRWNGLWISRKMLLFQAIWEAPKFS